MRYDNICKLDMLSEFTGYTQAEFDFMLAILNRHMHHGNFGIDGYKMEDYLLWTLTFLYKFREFRVIGRMAGQLEHWHISDKVRRCAEILATHLEEKYIRFRSYEEHVAASAAVFGTDE